MTASVAQWEEHGLWSHMDLVGIPSQQPTSCVTLGMFLCFSEPIFSLNTGMVFK